MYNLKRIFFFAFFLGILLNVVVTGLGFGGTDEKSGSISDLWPFGHSKFEVVSGMSVQAKADNGYTVHAELPYVKSEAEGGQRINAAIASDFVYLYAVQNGESSGRPAVLQTFSGWVNPTITVSYEKSGRGAVKTLTVTTEVQSDTAMKKVKIVNRYIYNLRTNELKTEQSSVV